MTSRDDDGSAAVRAFNSPARITIDGQEWILRQLTLGDRAEITLWLRQEWIKTQYEVANALPINEREAYRTIARFDALKMSFDSVEGQKYLFETIRGFLRYIYQHFSNRSSFGSFDKFADPYLQDESKLASLIQNFNEAITAMFLSSIEKESSEFLQKQSGLNKPDFEQFVGWSLELGLSFDEISTLTPAQFEILLRAKQEKTLKEKTFNSFKEVAAFLGTNGND